MKYIRRRKDKSNINHYDVQIRLAGERPIYNSFFSMIAAEKFVRQTLVAFDEGKLNHHKDKKATYSYSSNNFYLKAIKTIKSKFPEFTIMSDVAMDPYSSDGHDGLVIDGNIDNDQSLEILCKMALAQAEA